MSKWKKVALWKKILIGVVIGLIIGLVSPKAAEVSRRSATFSSVC